MPFYDFEHIENGKVVPVFFHMNDEKVYNGEDGKETGKWRRVYSVPLAAFDSIINPFDPKSFTAATNNKKGQTVGQMWERSAELSKMRADREGVDPVKQKFYDKYKKETGLKNQHQSQEETAKKAKELVKKLGFGT